MTVAPMQSPSALRGLIDALDVASLVPPQHADLRPLICDAAACFLEALPPARLDEIIGHQAALGLTATPALRVVTLMHDCPTLHKLGQVIARHRALTPDFRGRLQTLESMEPRTPLEGVLPMVEAELRPFASRFDLRVAEAALAEASVAIVLPLTWRPTPASPPQRGVVKVLKPGVARRVEQELAAMQSVADSMDARIAGSDIPPIDYRDAFDTVREILTHEIRGELEQRHLAAAVRQYAGSPAVHVPALLPFCTPHLTAMERIDGVKATEIRPRSAMPSARLARLIVESLVADIVFSTAPTVMFHADPHAGNLFATTDDRLAILDWSLTGTLSKRQREQIARVILAALAHDAAEAARATAELSLAPPDEAALRNAIADAFRELRRGALPGPAWLMRLLDRAASGGAARFPADLLLFRKSVLTIEGVVADISPDCTLDGVLIAAALQRFAAEGPARALAPLHSREFATHLSNADLLSLATSGPMAMMSMWTGWWRDLTR